ncbi:HIR complex subunit [Gaertneriomyces sp. JEL0708]|nr:HIR complex subunit [Gaertneriomyces sp. JEL0708]
MIAATLSWIAHMNDKRHKVPIYSIAVHPSGTKVATGGQDAQIKLWNLAPALDERLEGDRDTPKLIATLSAHSGTVLCVRWQNDHGRYLASGSDDCRIVVWSRDTGGVFGSGGTNNSSGNISRGNLMGDNGSGGEYWKPMKVLMGHESDVAHVEWSCDNTYLASCGFETSVYIWSGTTFEKLRKLEGHVAFVKGVTWDPSGKYLATQSDDKTVKIWRVSDWSVEGQVTKPFGSAASTTFFRRLDWSPDGSVVAAVNAEDGAVPVAALITRGDWVAENFVVGHTAPVECARFNSVLYEVSSSVSSPPPPSTPTPGNAEQQQQSPQTTTEPEGRKERSKESVAVICAIGSQDHGISVWSSAKNRAVVAAKRIFKHSVLDMSWTPDGMYLFACSYDGTVAMLAFEDGEFGTPVSAAEKERILSAYGTKRKQILESAIQMGLEEEERVESRKAMGGRMIGLMEGGSNGFGTPTPSTPTRGITATPVTPAHTNVNVNGPSVVPSPLPPATPVQIQKQKVTTTTDGRKRIMPTFLGSPAPVHYAQPQMGSLQQQSDTQMIEFAPTATSSQSVSGNGVPHCNIPVSNGRKRKADEMVDGPRVQYILPTIRTTWAAPNLALPAPKPKLVAHVPSLDTVLEYAHIGGSTTTTSSSNSGTHKLTCLRGTQQVWSDTLPHPVLFIGGTEVFYAAADVKGEVSIYSPAGRRVVPPVVLEGAPCYMVCEDKWLMCMTVHGKVWVWDVKTLSLTIDGVSIVPLLRPQFTEEEEEEEEVGHGRRNTNGETATTTARTTEMTITTATLLGDGTPHVTTSKGDAYAYHRTMKSWCRVFNPYKAMMTSRTGSGGLSFAPTTTELEVMLATHEMVGKRHEYQATLRRYARKLADEGMEEKAREVCDALLVVDNNNSSGGSDGSCVMGLPKRELLKEILPTLAKNRSMQRLTEYCALELAEAAGHDPGESMSE